MYVSPIKWNRSVLTHAVHRSLPQSVWNHPQAACQHLLLAHSAKQLVQVGCMCVRFGFCCCLELEGRETAFRCPGRLLSDHRKSLVREWAEQATARFVARFREENPASADNARMVRVACAESGTSHCPLRRRVSVDRLKLQGLCACHVANPLF